MKSLKSSHTKTLFWALFLSIGFVFGILGIIFGATKGITLLLVAGIVMTVLGFYGAPLVWIKYGEQGSYLAVLDCIVNDNLLSINSIASSIGKQPKAVLGIVNQLIAKRYLKGYFVENGELKPIQNDQEDAVITHKCPYCGATLSLDKEISSCEYCGAKLKVRMKK